MARRHGARPWTRDARASPGRLSPLYKTTYRLIANDNALGAALALFAADALKLKRVAIFYGGLDAQAGPMLRQMEQLGLADAPAVTLYTYKDGVRVALN